MSEAGNRHDQRRHTYPRRLLQAFLSALVPGVGQLLAGAHLRGLLMLAVVVVLLIAGVATGLQGVDQVLVWAVEPSVLLALLIVNVLLVLFRLLAVLDAYYPTEPRPRQSAASRRRVAAAVCGLALVIGFTVAPHAVAGYYIYLSRDLLTTVFVEDEGRPAETSTAALTTVPTTAPASTIASSIATTSSAAGTATTEGAGGNSTTVPTTTSTAEPPPETLPPVKGTEDGRLTILFLGSDAGYGRTGARADTIMLATFDLVTGRIALFGIPRNTGDTPLSEEAGKALDGEVYADLISSLYWEAREHPELAAIDEDPGAVVLRDSVSMLLDIPIDYYAVVDMGGFVDIVDALGGVTVNVETRLWVRLSPPTPDEEWRVYDIRPGIQHLDGLEALAFARSRTGSDDYVRMGRQRCVIAALLDQTSMVEMAWNFPAIARAIRESVRTDIPISALQELIKVRSELKTDEMITVGFTPPLYVTGLNEMGYNILDLDLVRSTVQQVIQHPEKVLESQDPDINVDDSDCWNFD